MNKEEILKEIEERKSAIKNGVDYIDFFNESIAKHENIIADLEQQLKQMEKKPPVVLWKPEEKETYFYIDGDVIEGFLSSTNNKWDLRRMRIGNAYPTRKLAELKRDITITTQEYKRKVAEFNGVSVS